MRASAGRSAGTEPNQSGDRKRLQTGGSAACETTYRAAAKTITETTGLSISPQGVWNIVQKLGEQQKARVERHAELAQHGQGINVLETKLLYEENDGIYLKLQGKDRKQYGKDNEMKVGIAYPGVR